MTSIPPVMLNRIRTQFVDKPEIEIGLDVAVQRSGAPPKSIHAMVVAMDWMIENGYDPKPEFHGVYGNLLNTLDNDTLIHNNKFKRDTSYFGDMPLDALLLITSTFTPTAYPLRASSCFYATCRAVRGDPDEKRFGALVWEACRSGAVYNGTSCANHNFTPNMAFPHIPAKFFVKQSMTGSHPAVMPYLDRLLRLDLECRAKSHFTETVDSASLARGFRTVRSAHEEQIVYNFAMDWWRDNRQQSVASKRSNVMLNISPAIANKLREVPVAVDGVTVWDRFAQGEGGTEDAMGACEIARLLLSSNGRGSSPEEFHVLCKQLAKWLRECSSSKQMGDILVGISRHMETVNSTEGPITGPSKHLQAVKSSAQLTLVRDREAEADFANMEVMPLSK